MYDPEQSGEKKEVARSPHKFEPFWQQVDYKCPPTYNTGAENVPKKLLIM